MPLSALSGEFTIGGHLTGSTDMGDLAHQSTELLATTAIDLLYNDAAPVREIVAGFEPAMTKETYLPF